MYKFISVALILICSNVFAQTVLFHENFDQPSGPDSVTTSSLTTSFTPTLWNDTSSLFTSSGYSYHVKGSHPATPHDVFFETQAFSTVGQSFVYLSFNQIAKLYLLNQARIEISTNNGGTWTNVYPSANYHGESPNYTSLGFFNTVSYGLDWQPTSNSGPTSIPDSSWWRKELIDLTPLLGTGHTQVKVRFRANFTGPSSSGFLSGWYVDDVQVLGSSCEIIPPVLSFDNIGACAYSPVIQGAQYNPLWFNETRYFITSDNHQIDSIRMVEIINNSTVRTQNANANSSGQFSMNFTNYNPFDTVQWRVEAYDSCGNMTSIPDTGYYKFHFVESYFKCPGSGFCGAAHQFITSFPWSQDFESTDWIAGNKNTGSSNIRGTIPEQLSYAVIPLQNQYWGWSVNQGSTPTASTGPKNDHTSGSGKYLYSEFYGQSSMINTNLDLPCVVLKDSVARALSFYYHMYGSDISRLNVFIDSSSSTTSSVTWHNALSIRNPQQYSESDEWIRADVDLSPYIGKVIKIRFSAVILPGSGAKANIAIDDLEIKEIVQEDVELVQIISPDESSLACYGTSNVSLTVNTKYMGLLGGSAVPMAYQVDNNPIVFDTLDLTGKAFGFDTNYTFTTPFTLSVATPHTIHVWSALSADGNLANDTLTLQVPVLGHQAINVFPHRIDFENQITGQGVNTVLNSMHWTLGMSQDSLTFWEVQESPFINEYYSPHNAQGMHNKALIVRPSAGGNSSYAEIESDCIDLNGVASPVLQFMFHGESTKVQLFVKEFEDINWTQLSAFPPSPATKSPMEGYTLALNAYAGKVVKLKIRVLNPTLPASVTVIDNLMIRSRPSQDLEITKVGLARIYQNQLTYPSTRVFFTNWAQSTGGSFPKTLKVELTDKCNPSAPVYTAQSAVLSTLSAGTNGTVFFSNLTFANAVPQGNYNAKIWVESPNDVYAYNDTVYQDLVCQSVESLPYVNDFENCNHATYLYGLSQQWQVSKGKSSLDSTHSGYFCAVTNPSQNSRTLSGNYDFMELPPISGIDTLYGAELGFWQNFDFQNQYSFGVVEILDGTNWIALTNGNQYGTNWRSHTSNVSNANYSRGFTGNSNGWIKSSYPLDEYKTPGQKIIRFISYSQDTPGWAIDSIYINYPEQNSGAPIALNLQGNVAQAGLNVADLKIKNTANAPLNEIRISIEESGTVIHTEIATFSPAILAGQSATVPLSQPLQLDSTMSQLLVYTSRPNDRKDEITADDTLIVPIQILGTVDSSAACFNFERQFDFSPYSPTRGLSNTGWEKGSPSKTLLDSAYAGSSCWFTSGNEYDIQQNSYLITPEFALTGTYCYRLGFWHQFDFEKNFDGANVEYTLDGGNSWDVLGRYWSTDSAWYNHQYIQSLDANKPGWSGNSGGWIYSNYDFHVFWNDTVQFRFRYATDADINYEGWAIDEVCFEIIPESCTSIGIDEEETVQSEIALYPNPATSELNLKCGLEGVYEIAIYSSKGSLIRSWSENLEMGKILQIDIEALTPGFYSIGINGHSTSTSKRFVKTR